MKFSIKVVFFFILGMLFLGCQSSPKNTSATSEEEQFQTSPADYKLIKEGTSLSEAQATELKSRLKMNPEDWSARLSLLGYSSHYYFKNNEAKQLNREIVLWLAQNKPENPVSTVPAAKYDSLVHGQPRDPAYFKQLQQVWTDLARENPANELILNNASEFLLGSDRTAAEKIIKQALAQHPHSLHWHYRLFELYHLNAGFCDATKETGSKAYSEILIIEKMDVPAELSEQIKIESARYSYISGDETKARAEALALLSTAENKKDCDCGDSIANGHMILGLLALDKKDYSQAEDHLLASTKAKSGIIDSFGPNVCLAKRLLEQKKTAPVLEYLKQLGPVWSMGADSLAKWKKEISKGKTPDFGANLNY